MLEEYIPDDAPDYYHGDHYPGPSANPREYIEEVVDPAVVTGSFPFVDGSYYKPTGDVIERPPVLAGRSIVDRISWRDLPDDHEYHRTATHDAADRPYVRLYGRIRGILVHSLVLDDGVGVDEAVRRAREDIDGLPGDMSYTDLYDAVARWEGAPRVRPAEDEHVYDVPREALHRRVEDEAHAAASNWHRAEHDIRLQPLADEVVTLGETEGGHGYGCRMDRLGYVDTSDAALPLGLYVAEIKTAEEWHPAHLVQAEAYRRSLVPDLRAEPHGVLVRLGAERGDYTVVSSHDDAWDAEELWGLFETKARWMYEADGSPYPPALKHVDPR